MAAEMLSQGGNRRIQEKNQKNLREAAHKPLTLTAKMWRRGGPETAGWLPLLVEIIKG